MTGTATDAAELAKERKINQVAIARVDQRARREALTLARRRD